jgi:hypothetical protein
LENPARGCLFIDTAADLNFFLIVFRRRGIGSFNPSENSARNRPFCGLPHFAPPKNKKEVVLRGTFSYKQATLTDFGPGFRTVGLMRDDS